MFLFPKTSGLVPSTLMMWGFPTPFPLTLVFACLKSIFNSRHQGKLWYESCYSFGHSPYIGPILYPLFFSGFPEMRSPVISPTSFFTAPRPTLCFSKLLRAPCPMLLFAHVPFPLLPSVPEKPILNHHPRQLLAQGSLPPGMLPWLHYFRVNLGFLSVLHFADSPSLSRHFALPLS